MMARVVGFGKHEEKIRMKHLHSFISLAGVALPLAAAPAETNP